MVKVRMRGLTGMKYSVHDPEVMGLIFELAHQTKTARDRCMYVLGFTTPIARALYLVKGVASVQLSEVSLC